MEISAVCVFSNSIEEEDGREKKRGMTGFFIAERYSSQMCRICLVAQIEKYKDAR
jgi:hypothetical protein